ncbi:MAG: PspC domain-containing protein [Candidatus Cloacimonadota bacterium]|nr:PspC domain-containing protein [Candidatus Cloacimonadota bacterium]
MNVKKKLYRDLKSKKIAGVCSGLAEYFDIDVTLVRVIWVLLTLLGGAGVLSYLVAIIIIPKKPNGAVEGAIVEKDKEKARLHLSKSDKFIFGVCGGLAEYFNIDSSLVRILFVVMLCSVGFGILLYLVLAIVIPKEKG